MLTGESRFHLSTPLGIWTWVPCDGKQTGSPLEQWDMVRMMWDCRLSTCRTIRKFNTYTPLSLSRAHLTVASPRLCKWAKAWTNQKASFNFVSHEVAKMSCSNHAFIYCTWVSYLDFSSRIIPGFLLSENKLPRNCFCRPVIFRKNRLYSYLSKSKLFYKLDCISFWRTLARY